MRILTRKQISIAIAGTLVGAGIAGSLWLINAARSQDGAHDTLVAGNTGPPLLPPPIPALPVSLIAVIQHTGHNIQLSSSSEALTSVQTAEGAALAQNPPGSAVMAASLVKVVLLSHGTAPLLAWGIEIDPAGGEHSVGAPGVPVQPGNYRLDIVSAQTGTWLAAFAGHAATMPSLPSLPAR